MRYMNKRNRSIRSPSLWRSFQGFVDCIEASHIARSSGCTCWTPLMSLSITPSWDAVIVASHIYTCMLVREICRLQLRSPWRQIDTKKRPRYNAKGLPEKGGGRIPLPSHPTYPLFYIFKVPNGVGFLPSIFLRSSVNLHYSAAFLPPILYGSPAVLHCPAAFLPPIFCGHPPRPPAPPAQPCPAST